MLFLGGKQQKKNEGESKGNEISRFALRALLQPSAERKGLRPGFLRRG
jgi:hypothetical protein